MARRALVLSMLALVTGGCIPTYPPILSLPGPPAAGVPTTVTTVPHPTTTAPEAPPTTLVPEADFWYRLAGCESGNGRSSPNQTCQLMWEIALCESGGDPTAISPDGVNRGLLQFDYATWRSVGGEGDPATASREEQFERGLVLYGRRGNSPWPNCP